MSGDRPIIRTYAVQSASKARKTRVVSAIRPTEVEYQTTVGTISSASAPSGTTFVSVMLVVKALLRHALLHLLAKSDEAIVEAMFGQPRPRQVDIKYFFHSAGPAREHDHAIGQICGL